MKVIITENYEEMSKKAAEILIDIVKKNGDQRACEDETLRKDLVEELADVLMYYNDVMLCYGITAEELKSTYTQKFERNMKRW